MLSQDFRNTPGTYVQFQAQVQRTGGVVAILQADIVQLGP